LQILCALAFGKDEDGGGFGFTQELVDDAVTHLKSNMTGGLMPFFATLPAYFLRPLVHLCISGASGCSHQLVRLL
jgi:hypothetical protein